MIDRLDELLCLIDAAVFQAASELLERLFQAHDAENVLASELHDVSPMKPSCQG